MNQHAGLTVSHWKTLTLETQLANIGSEVIRTLKWQAKGRQDYANLANLRSLELFDFTLACPHRPSAIREIARARELWLDFFIGENQYLQTAPMWEKYFFAFNFASQNNY
jgi:hypothetical protein